MSILKTHENKLYTSTDTITKTVHSNSIIDKSLSIPTLLLLVSFASVGAVLVTPTLPSISAYFEITAGKAQLTVTLYLLGIAFGQLIYGPLANRFGRKPILYLGIIIEILNAFLSGISASVHSFELLIISRIFMALGACVGLMMTFTMIGDKFEKESATKIISYITLAFAITPGIAIAIGGFLTTYIDWSVCFYFLALYGILLLILSYQLPETSRNLDPQALKMDKIFKNYWVQIQDKRLIICSLLAGSTTAIVYLFATQAPFIAIQLLHIKPNVYGLWNLLPPLGIATGSLMSVYLLTNFSSIKRILIGITITATGSCVMLTLFLTTTPNIGALFFPIPVIYMGIPIIYATATSIATTHSTDKSNASAILNLINMGSGAFIVLFAGIIAGRVMCLPLSFLVMAFIMCMLFLMLSRIKN